MDPSPQACAAELLDVVPLIMRTIRAEVRRRKGPEFSVPQFRALAFVGRNEGVKLRDLAEFLGLTPPSASKLIDGLVSQRLIVREIPSADRRRLSLALSPAGTAKYRAVMEHARDFLASRVAHLSHSERHRLLIGMGDLRAAFEGTQPSEVACDKNGAPGKTARKRRTLKFVQKEGAHA